MMEALSSSHKPIRKKVIPMHAVVVTVDIDDFEKARGALETKCFHA